MSAAVIFGSLMLAAILAHHGSPWLAFILGVMTLVVFSFLSLSGAEQEEES